MKERKADSKEVRIFIPCDCHSEILEFSYWIDDGEPDDMYFLTMYKSCYGHSIWWRLKQAWKYFRRGEFEGNSIVLYKPEFIKFVDELQKHRLT